MCEWTPSPYSAKLAESAQGGPEAIKHARGRAVVNLPGIRRTWIGGQYMKKTILPRNAHGGDLKNGLKMRAWRPHSDPGPTRVYLDRRCTMKGARGGGKLVATKDLSKNLNYVKKNKERLLKEYPNKFLLIFEEKVAGSFDTYEAAAGEGIRQFGIDGVFLVQQVTESEPVNFVMEAMF